MSIIAISKFMIELSDIIKAIGGFQTNEKGKLPFPKIDDGSADGVAPALRRAHVLRKDHTDHF